MTKIAFFYAIGTSYIFNDLNGLSVDLTGTWRFRGNVIGNRASGAVATIPGLNGSSTTWDLGSPGSDPFPAMLNQEVWTTKIIEYPASFFGGTNYGLSMGASVTFGTEQMIKAINDLPAGTPFAIGGYSQGAAAASGCYLAGLQPGTTGPLESRRSQFLGAVCFGNPRRALEHYGAVGGVWNGGWDSPGSTTGGHGAFPATGPFRRLSNCESKWAEFSNPSDIFSCVTSNTPLGLGWTAAIDVFLDLTKSQFGSYILNGLVGDALFAAQRAMFDPLPFTNNPIAVGKQENRFVDGANRTGSIGGGGHTTYPMLGQANADGTYAATTVSGADGLTYLKPAGKTCYQLGLEYLEGLASQYAVAPDVLPAVPTSTSTAGWTTTLIPPAA